MAENKIVFNFDTKGHEALRRVFQDIQKDTSSLSGETAKISNKVSADMNTMLQSFMKFSEAGKALSSLRGDLKQFDQAVSESGQKLAQGFITGKMTETFKEFQRNPYGGFNGPPRGIGGINMETAGGGMGAPTPQGQQTATPTFGGPNVAPGAGGINETYARFGLDPASNGGAWWNQAIGSGRMTVNDLASALNAQQQGAGQPSQVGKIGMEKPMAFSGPGSGAPYDPRTPGYQPGAGWQTMLRQYAMRDGQGNPNQYVQDRGLNPMWGGQQQPWEPQGFAGGLSQLLQRYRGF